MEVERNILQLNAVRIYQPYFRRKVIPDFPKHGISLVIPGAWAPASDEPKHQGPRNQHTGFSRQRWNKLFWKDLRGAWGLWMMSNWKDLISL